MSRAKGRATAAPVSLFSFQDVMTSVIGILLLVTLLLALHFTTVATVGAASMHPESRAADLQRDIERLERLTAEAQRRLDEAKESVRMAGATLPTTGRQLLGRRMGELRDVHREIEDAESEAAALAAKITEIGAAEQTAGGVVNERSMAQQTVDRLRAELEGSLRNSRLTYVSPRGVAKKPLLVEISGDEIRFGFADEGAQIVVAKGPDEQARRLAALSWVKGFPSSAYFVLLLVKPSGVETALDLQEEIERLGIDLGIDPLPEDLTALGGFDSGAAP